MLQSEWGVTVAIDLFLSGFGGCLFAFAAVVFLVFGDRFRGVVRIGAWTAFLAVLAGVLFLLIDVGQPLRAMWLFGAFVNFDSWMPRGAWSLALTMIVFLLFALTLEERTLGAIRKISCFGNDEKGTKNLAVMRIILAVTGIALGLFVTAYTGFLLKGSMSIPFWNTELLPISFICLSLSVGSATALMLVSLKVDTADQKEAGKPLSIATIVCAIASGLSEALYLSSTLQSDGAAHVSAEWVLSNPLFILGAICLVALLAAGIVSFVLIRRGKNLKTVGVVACICAIVAGFAFRYCILGGGQHEALTSIDVAQMKEGITFFFR